MKGFTIGSNKLYVQVLTDNLLPTFISVRCIGTRCAELALEVNDRLVRQRGGCVRLDIALATAVAKRYAVNETCVLLVRQYKHRNSSRK